MTSKSELIKELTNVSVECSAIVRNTAAALATAKIRISKEDRITIAGQIKQLEELTVLITQMQEDDTRRSVLITSLTLARGILSTAKGVLGLNQGSTAAARAGQLAKRITSHLEDIRTRENGHPVVTVTDVDKSVMANLAESALALQELIEESPDKESPRYLKLVTSLETAFSSCERYLIRL